MKIFIFLFILLNIIPISEAKVLTQPVEYNAEGNKMKGYFTYDDEIIQKRPGILIVHEWWGLNDYIRIRARMLAQLGYTSFSIDMYGDGKTADHPEKANEFMQTAFKQWDISKINFNKALKILRTHKTVDPTKVASIGYCFGGAVSLKMARSGVDLNGVVSFHGALPLEPSIKPGKVKAAILIINGSEDTFLKSETVASFMKGMYEANTDLTYINLAGVKHSFTNPKADELKRKFNIKNLEYNKNADERSWLEMQRFFNRIFKKNKK